MTVRRRSFAWGLEPEWAERPPGTPQRWWLVEMEDGEPRRAFLPPTPLPSGGAMTGENMDRAHRDSFVRWSLRAVPSDAPATLAPVHTYMGQRCVLENRR